MLASPAVRALAPSLLVLLLAAALPAQIVTTPGGRVWTDAQGRRAVVTLDPGTAAVAPREDAPGADAWEPLGPFGGDATDIAFHPTVADLAFATIASSSGLQGGVFRSTDGGQTWDDVGDAGMGGVYDADVSADGSVWLGTLNSPWVSTDGGLTFQKRGLGIGLNDQTFAVAVDPGDPQAAYAAVGEALGANPDTLLVTGNGGTSWTPLSIGQPAGFSGTTVAIDASDPSLRAAGFSGSFGAGSAVFVSTDGGSSWVDRTAGLPSSFGPVNELVFDGGDLYVAGGQLFGGNPFGLWRSTDLGASWTELSASWSNKATNGVAVHPGSGVVLAAVAGDGVLRSTDGGTSWTVGFGGTAGLSATAVVFDLLDGTRLGAGADGGGPYLADDGATFVQSAVGISFLDVHGVASDPGDPTRMAAAFQSLNSGGVMRSDDGGASWTPATGLPGERFNDVHYDAAGRLFALADGPTTVGTEGVWRSSDNGTTWTSLGPDLGSQFETELFAVTTSAADPDRVLVGGSNFGVAGAEAKIYASTDGGSTWTDVHTGAANNDVQALSLRDDGGALAGVTDFAGTGLGGVLVSGDGGATWSGGSAGLPAAPQVYDLAHDPFVPGRAFCAVSITGPSGGLHRSDDDGASWSLVGPFENGRYLAKSRVRDGGAVLSTFQIASTSETEDGGAGFADWSAGLPDVGANARALRGAVDTPPRALLASSRGVFRRTVDALAVNGTPALGATVGVRFDGRPGYQFWMFVGLDPGSVPVGTLGVLELSEPWILTPPVLVPAGGLLAFDASIPNDGALSGLTVLLQGVGLDGAQLPIKVGAFSNLEEVPIP